MLSKGLEALGFSGGGRPAGPLTACGEGDDLAITCVFISQITVPSNGDTIAAEQGGS